MSRRTKIKTSFEGVDMSSTVEPEQTLNNKERFWKALKESISKAFNVKPIHVHGQDDWRTDFYRTYLRNIVKSVIKIEVNADWDIDYFKDVFLFQGKICVTEINGTNYALDCGTHGVSAYNRENYVTIANPILGNHDRINTVDAAMIYLMSEKTCENFSMLVDIYACKLAMCDSAIDVNLMNSKVAYVFDCASEKQAKEAKLIYQKVTEGEPAVFFENDGLGVTKQLAFFRNDVKNNYVVDLVQDSKRAIISEFLTMVGINNGAVEKKERLLYDEVNGNNMEIMCSVSYSEELVESGVKTANKLFPYLNLKITWDYLNKMREKEKAMLNESSRNADVKRSSAETKSDKPSD